MECSTNFVERKLPSVGSIAKRLVIYQWQQTPHLFGVDLEATAREKKAFERVRHIRSALDLLRIVLFYATSDWSLRLVGAWAELQSIASLSDVAVLKRLCKAKEWIAYLIVVLLQQRCSALQSLPGVRLRLRDATTVSKKGSRGTDWRIHLSLDLGNTCLDGIEVTDAHGGETLVRFEASPQDILIADRGYAFARSFARFLAEGVQLIVRINWQNLPLKTQTGQRFKVIDWLSGVSMPAQQALWVDTPEGTFPIRVIACPIPEHAVALAQKKAKERNQKKKRKVSQSTLIASRFVLLVTNLPAEVWTPEIIGRLYRIRWQVELAIKRLKSILQLDHIRGKDPQLVQTYLLAKLLAALLLDGMIALVEQQVPEWWDGLERPVSVWRLTTYLWDSICQIVRGSVTYDQFFDKLPRLGRYFCDTPRKRVQQMALARAFLAEAAFCSPFFNC